MGDLNARHTAWDTRRNTLGVAIHAWCCQHQWRVKAPLTHTREQDGHTSMLDIALYRQLRLSEISAIQEWELSDHGPVVAEIDHPHNLARENKGYITYARRKLDSCLDTATCQITKHMDALTTNMDNAETPEQQEEAYKKLLNTALTPLYPRKRSHKETSPPGRRRNWTR